jgi:acyl-CoA thioester hydrolase
MDQPRQPARNDYAYFTRIQTRWMDNDIYGHVNNVVYYSYFDTIVNKYTVEVGGLDIHNGEVIGLVVESMCRYHQPASFPEELEAGLRVARLGNSSVRYEIGLFRPTCAEPVVTGHFIHVFVDRQTRRPTAITASMRAGMEKLLRSDTNN